MRRLILEVSQKELTKIGVELPQFNQIKSLELLYFLRQDQEEFAAISRVEFKQVPPNIEEILVGGFLVEAQILEQQKNGTYIVFTRSGPLLSSVLNSMNIEMGYLFPPLEVRDGKVKVSFVGSEQQVKQFMEKIDAIGIRYRVTLLTDANFSPMSPLSQLTEKQRQVLLSAYQHGYYDIPRRVTSEELARKLGLVDSTVVEHLRKAELRLIKQIIEHFLN
jgi:ribosomal protein S13